MSHEKQIKFSTKNLELLLLSATRNITSSRQYKCRRRFVMQFYDSDDNPLQTRRGLSDLVKQSQPLTVPTAP